MKMKKKLLLLKKYLYSSRINSQEKNKNEQYKAKNFHL